MHTQPGPQLCCFHKEFWALFTGQSDQIFLWKLKPKFPSQVYCPPSSTSLLSSFPACLLSLPCPSACALLQLQPTVHLWQSSSFWSSSWVVSLSIPKLLKCLPTAPLYPICVVQHVWSSTPASNPPTVWWKCRFLGPPTESESLGSQYCWRTNVRPIKYKPLSWFWSPPGSFLMGCNPPFWLLYPESPPPSQTMLFYQ